MMKQYVDASIIKAVWNKAIPVAGYNPAICRKDMAGAWIVFDAYGDTNSVFGWEIDHKVPLARGGSSNLYNLQPLQWENNRSKGDSYPSCQFMITSSGERNVRLVRYLSVA